MKKNNALVWAFGLLTTIASLTACGLDMPKEKLTSFETMVVKKSDVEIPIRFSAKMKGQADVTIMPQVSGQLMKICVTEGQQVRKGQTLFIIDSRNARLDLQAAQSNLQAALAQENSAKLEYESNKNLFEKNIVSRYMLDNSQNAYRQAQASVSQARAQVSRAKVNLGFCTITSPVTGVIGEIPVRGGDQVTPMTQLTILSGNTTMDAEFSVTEAIVESQVQSGMKPGDKEKHITNLPDVTFVMKNGTEYPHKGRITSLTGVVDAWCFPASAAFRFRQKAAARNRRRNSACNATSAASSAVSVRRANARAGRTALSSMTWWAMPRWIGYLFIRRGRRSFLTVTTLIDQ